MRPLDSLVPMIHVANVLRSIAFYKKFGFEVDNAHVPDGETEPSWAWLRSGGAHLMVAQVGGPVNSRAQAALFYVYCDDVPSFRAQLQKNGVEAGEIEYPFYNPRGEFRVTDPDSYCLMITHTG